MSVKQFTFIEIPKTVFGPLCIIEGNGVKIRATGKTIKETKANAIAKLKGQIK